MTAKSCRSPLLYIVAYVVAALSPLLAHADDYGYLDQLYKHFHTHPELSFKEGNTAERVAQELRKAGFKVTEKVGGAGVVAVLENGPGPVVMLRTDLDALPVKEQTNLPYASKVTTVDEHGNTVGVMHACGHDIHMTSLIGAARSLAEMKSKWRGTLILIGQPAEERGAGAKAMLDDGLYRRFPKPDFAVALHTSATEAAGTLAFAPGPALASVDSVDLTVRGIGGHGAYPHKTKDPIVLASEIVMALQTIVSREVKPIEPAVVTVGSIHGGAKHNIISDEVKLQLTVRAYSPQVRDQILEAIKRISTGLARAGGLPEDLLPVITLPEEHVPATINDPALTQRLVTALKPVLGEQNVVQVEPVMGGEDFSRYSLTEEKIPAVIFWLGAVQKEKFKKDAASLPSLHSPFFAPDPEPTIRTGVKALTQMALTLLDKPQ